MEVANTVTDYGTELNALAYYNAATIVSEKF
jgi:hypothetical protein